MSEKQKLNLPKLCQIKNVLYVQYDALYIVAPTTFFSVFENQDAQFYFG